MRPLIAVAALALASCAADPPSSDVLDPLDTPDTPAPPDTPSPDVPDSPDAAEPPGRCSAPPEAPFATTGPLTPPMQPKRGIDAWERPAYEALRDAVLEDPGVHFVAIWDAEAERFVVESGPENARKLVAFRREGASFEVLEGAVADIFPNTDPRIAGTLAELMEAVDAAGTLPVAAQSWPLPLERLAALFDAPAAPDVIGSLQPWAWPSPGTHGAMSALQSRSTLVISGKGARAGIVLDEAAILPDVVPTVLAALGAPTTGGMGPDGARDDGLFVLRQDGRALWEGLAEDPCDRASHAIVFDFDGLQATELLHQALDDDAEVDLPAFRALVAGGVAWRYGAVANFPSVSAPGHMTLGTGLWAGHHGFVANAFWDRASGAAINPFALLSALDEVLEDPQAGWDLYNAAVAPGTETLAQAVHRALGPEERVVVLNEIAIGGADWTTVDYLTGVPLPGKADVSKYALADSLAVTQALQVLAHPDFGVPTVMQISMLATDGAGEQSGPHSDALRQALVAVDAHVGTILDAYAERGALEDTFVVLASDHGMETQDPARASQWALRLQESGVKVDQPFAGLIYLRTLRVEGVRDGAQVTITVTEHQRDLPLAGVTVTCDGCTGEPVAVTDPDGQAVFTADGPAQYTAEHPDFNTQIVETAD